MAYTTINDPSANFQTALWTGNNTTQAITNDGNSNLQPDLVWLKMRSAEASQNHRWIDSTRGVTKNLSSNNNNAEATEATGLTAFNSDGFTLGGAGGYNGNGRTYVGWQWKANGGTTASNSDGSITSTVQANTTAGFSVVTYSGDGNGNFTVGHGLNSALDFITVKRLDGTSNWYTWHKDLTSGAYVFYLNAENGQANEATIWNSTAPTSSVFTIGTDGNIKTTGNYVAYCFHSVQGYSKFGKYKGNGNNDGPFIYTGFKPAYVMIKNLSNTSQWPIIDAARDPVNVTDARLRANTNAAEATETFFDFLSNGFKVRATGTDKNDSGNNYIYMAFAENPLVASNNVIALAR
tara:strand:- start:670 stop:1719 length:1050 start_codon:yes stop_codon:yes gene_type:complete